MDTTYGPAAASLSGLTRGIREYSLFQAVLLVIDRLREAHPHPVSYTHLTLPTIYSV